MSKHMTFGVLTAVGVMIAMTAAAQAAPVLAWYSPLDGNADATVGGVNGTLNGNTTGTADRANNANSALLFDGNGDNVVINKSTLPASFSEGSITTWARVDTRVNDTGFVGVGGSGGSGIKYFNILLAGGGDNIRADVDRGAGGNLDRKDAQDPASINYDWHHLAMTFVAGGGTDALRLYIDGAEVNNEDLNDLTPVTPSFDWTIGSDRTNDRYLTGAVDDVAIWSTALSAAEVRALAKESETPMSLADPTNWSFQRDMFDNDGGARTAAEGDPIGVGTPQLEGKWLYMRAAIAGNGDVIASDDSDFLIMNGFAGTDWQYGGGHPTVRVGGPTAGTVHPDDGEAAVVAWESDFTGSVDYSYVLTENNNNIAASPGYQLFFWDDSAGLLTLIAKDDLLGTLTTDMFASESTSGSQAVEPGDMLLMAIDDGGNGNGNDRTIVDAVITPATGGIIPEPMTMLAVGLGISGLGGYMRRRRRA